MLRWPPFVFAGALAIDTPQSAPRLPTAIPIRLTDGWTGEVLNMSATGMRVRTILMLRPGQPFEGVLQHDGREVVVQGFVVWADPPEFDVDKPGEAGISLVDVSREYFDLLAGLFAD